MGLVATQVWNFDGDDVTAFDDVYHTEGHA